MNKLIYTLVTIAVVAGLAQLFIGNKTTPETPNTNEEEQVLCTADAMLCPDGTYVGRSGPNCEFACPIPEVPEDVQVHIDSKADLIAVSSPSPLTEVDSPLEVSGEARGYWYFEASAPVTIVDWDGLIIGEGYVTAESDWMTTEFVPFSGTISFTNPYTVGDPDYMKKGTIIFMKDNPSDLPENDDALEIPIYFAP